VSVIPRDGRRRLESLDGEVDAKRQLPQELRDCRNPLPRAALVEDVEKHGDPRKADQRTSDEKNTNVESYSLTGRYHASEGAILAGKDRNVLSEAAMLMRKAVGAVAKLFGRGSR
jgi:hypothetical protein